MAVNYKKVGKNQLDETEDDIEMYDVGSKAENNEDTEITEDMSSVRSSN